MKNRYRLPAAALIAATQVVIALSACAPDAALVTSPYTVDDTSAQGDETDGSTSTSKPELDVEAITLADGEEPVCMTADDDSVFWVRRDGTVGAVSTTNVPSVGSPVLTYQPVGKPLLGGQRCGLVRDGAYLWVTSFATNTVLRYPVVKTVDFTVQFGAEITTLTGFSKPTSIAVDDDFIYVTELEPAVIRRVAKPGTADAGAADAFLGAGPSAGDLVVDATSLYWSSAGSLGEILLTMPKTGGIARTLSTRAGLVHELGASLYFQCFYQLCTVPAGGGLTTIVSAPAGSTAPSPEVHGLALFQQDLYYADGNYFHHIGTSDQRLFSYAGQNHDVTLLAQRNRLVWSDGKGIFTRVAELNQ